MDGYAKCALNVHPLPRGRVWPVDRFYARDNAPITITEWARKRRDFHYCLLGQWEGGTGEYVRTYWVGVDVNFGDDGATTIFEAHIRVETDRHFYRYCTEVEARTGHDNALWYVKRGIKPWDDTAVHAVGGTPSK